MSADENKSDSVWLFTYGTLFWDCEFAYKERQVGFIHGFKRRYDWIDNHCRGLPGSEGRVVTLCEVSSEASEEDLLEYKKLPPSESHELDDACCWGKVFRFKRNKFEAKIKDEVTKRYPEGFQEVRTTFYPMGENMDPIENVLCYMGKRPCDSVAGDSTNSEIADIIVNATGIRGSNASYAKNLAQGLRNLDISQSKAPQIFQIEKLVNRKLEVKKQEDYLKRALDYYFNKVDTDKNGVVTVPEFVKLALSFSEENKDDDSVVAEIIRSIDKDKDGAINREEFMAYFLDRFRQSNSTSRPTSIFLQRMINKDGIKGGFQDIDLVDRILFGVQQVNEKDLMDETDGSELMGLEDYLDKNQSFYQKLNCLANDKAKRILEFMFPNSIEESMNLWFGKSPATDDYIQKEFGKMVVEARDGQYDDWVAHPLECLALIILLDQFPRNIYRHKPEMYASDYKAQGIVAQILYLGHHRYLSPLHAVFMPCLVLTHAENVHLQKLCVTIWNHYVQKKLKPNDPLFTFEGIFLNHLKVVEKFKRFPHRNEIHGRKSTPEEVKFLDDPAFRFDLPLVFKEDGTVTFAPTEEFNNRQQLVEDILENED